jgi:glycosyltransferase involved in cell wall biosynthesis
MRIAFLVSKVNLDTGGGSNYSLHLTASELTRLGHDVHVITLNPGATHLPDTLPYTVTSAAPGGRSKLGRTSATSGVLRQYADRTDIFHLYDPSLAFAGGLYKRTDGSKPVVVTLNHYQLFCTNPDLMDGHCHEQCGIAKRVMHGKRSPMRKLLSLHVRVHEQLFGFDDVNRVDHFLPDSPAVQKIYAAAGFDMRKSTVIPEVIDYETMRARTREMDGAPAKDNRGAWQILFAGRLVSGKGLDVLLEALRFVHAPIHLHVAGDGPQREPAVARVRALGMESMVTFHGWVPNEELWRMYQQVDLFVHPGTWPEPCGRTIQEAMTVGVPVIVSNVGGPPWLLGEFGRTFHPGDPRDLARQIVSCFEHYPEALDQAHRATVRATEFDYPRVVARLEELYTGLTRN